MGTTKMYAPALVLLSILAVGGFSSPSGFADNNDMFARCEVCHIESAETTRTSPHNLMRCVECHTTSGFGNGTHNATIPQCNKCHEDIISSLQHQKFSYLPEPYFVYNPNVTSDDKGTYITIVEPANTTIKR